MDRFLEFDLSFHSAKTLSDVLAPLGPLAVIHAAGRTPPADAPAMFSTNTRGTACLLEAIQLLQTSARMVLVGSAAELGPVPVDQLPAHELTPCRPVDSYGLSKWSSTRLGLSASNPGRLEVMVGRLFNPIGPAVPTSQVFGRLARELSMPRMGVAEMVLGNLGASRDFFDVRDAASALITLIHEGKHGQLYHIGSGTPHTVAEGLGHLIRLSGRSVSIRGAGDPPRQGPSSSWASISRVLNETSWRPRISFEQSLKDLWDDVSLRQALRDSPQAEPRQVA